MGLLRAGVGALTGVLEDTWREYFYCDAMSADVLMVKGQKRTTRRSTNRQGTDNIISNGSIVAVNNGQCMIIVDQGKVAEFCAEPGEFVYDSGTEPSLLYGSLGANLKKTFSNIGRRFSFGADTGKDQRVYFFNTKEIMGNKYGTPAPIPFRVVDERLGMDFEAGIRCHGEYSYKIADPLLFYTNVCGNVTDSFRRDQIDNQLKSELMTALQPAFAKISAKGVRYSALPGYTTEIADALNELLSKSWGQNRGIQVAAFGISSVKATDEDEAAIKEAQLDYVRANPAMAAAREVRSRATAMESAAKNTATGPMMAFAGMNMMGANVGNNNAAQLFAMGQQQQQQAAPAAGSWTCECGQVNTGKFCQGCGKAKPEPKAAGGWKCSCGTENTGKFCVNCGKAKPEEGWKCSCGAVNQGKFCAECGAKKPAGAPLYRCDKCGWKPEDPTHPPKFCPECGDIFDEKDQQ